jgi:hypothetical protein
LLNDLKAIRKNRKNAIFSTNFGPKTRLFQRTDSTETS